MKCSGPNCLLLLDGYKGVEDVLNSKKVDILKINASELKTLMNEEDIPKAATECMTKYEIPLVAITSGPNKAHLFQKETGSSSKKILICQDRIKHYEFLLPQLENVVNPIGAGDTASAVLMVGLLEKLSPSEAFKRALAAASASCLYMEGAKLDVHKMNEINSKIQLTEINEP